MLGVLAGKISLVKLGYIWYNKFGRWDPGLGLCIKLAILYLLSPNPSKLDILASIRIRPIGEIG